ncbi:23S rRNA (adenine(2503)-C(2))-methyltransferase RlmN [Clostridium sp. 19966]|uniref:23S rRNA (adenine(2503)-C(2))-methyltransferase RlmN n=1 Tax=Clostridium sp. 19966 TaxID=2768166 RepID=UPI0028DFA4EE|nr:23S rRNA (adenine(2503)-C(2))-methyltransferase RlmN [Clostridium sp. 19966]MDT8716473.1 23S rRNA (adenine(2503)-C(2))-methyltransferase RlmN [Clostridium sp. 19966]
MINILDLTLEELETWIKERRQSTFRAKQVFDWLYKGVSSFQDMKNINNELRMLLQNNFYIGLPDIVEALHSDLDDTRKLLLKYKDGNVIEAVIMKYKYGNTICISSQVGCRMGCKFCASTLNGMVRNLTAGEMIGEIIAASKLINERISNVVIMGSGEPMDNYDNIIKFIELSNFEKGLNIGQRHITVSTCGLVPKIYELADNKYQITLAISLHAPNDDVRKMTMPIANKYSIVDIMDACKYYINMTGRRITFEYALINGVNDSKSDALELSSLIKGMLCHVNLIPMNEVKESSLKKSNAENIQSFKSILEREGIQTTIRRELGSDINAACGQLRKSYIENQSSK